MLHEMESLFRYPDSLCLLFLLVCAACVLSKAQALHAVDAARDSSKGFGDQTLFNTLRHVAYPRFSQVLRRLETVYLYIRLRDGSEDKISYSHTAHGTAAILI